MKNFNVTGTCFQWSLFIIDVRLSNPNKSSHQVYTEIVNTMMATPVMYAQFINSYINFAYNLVFDSVTPVMEKHGFLTKRQKTPSELSIESIIKHKKEIISLGRQQLFQNC